MSNRKNKYDDNTAYIFNEFFKKIMKELNDKMDDIQNRLSAIEYKQDNPKNIYKYPLTPDNISILNILIDSGFNWIGIDYGGLKMFSDYYRGPKVIAFVSEPRLNVSSVSSFQLSRDGATTSIFNRLSSEVRIDLDESFYENESKVYNIRDLILNKRIY